MSEEFIESGKLLCHEFFWGEKNDGGWGFRNIPPYDTDWNELMGIIELIEDIRLPGYGWFRVTISSNVCDIESEHLGKDNRGLKLPDGTRYPVYMSDPNAVFETKIESTFYNVVQFLKFWNDVQCKA